ncbi:MAG: hypothetical protein KF691_11585 [Phycisphaeraceae bacterium]|nr:hypothetical protein [Phycisphaeraceae bacterium]
MELLTACWLAIIATPVALWFYGALAWMALPHHKRDLKKLPDDNKVIEFVRGLGLQPGVYSYPNMHCEGEDRERIKKLWETGPMGILSVWSKVSMGRNMLLTFIVELIAAFLIAYVGVAAGFGRGEPFAKVFQVLGTVGILTFTVGSLPGAIWFQANKSAVVSGIIDGVIMGLITGAIMAWLWPK